MPAWLVSAMGLLGRGVAVTRGRLASARTLALVGGASAAGVALADPAGGLLPSIFDEEEPKRRRRRRRALTASDRADIAFVAGALGQAAGKAFAVQLVAGLTR